MAKPILNLNKYGQLTMDETEQLYNDFDAQVQGESRPIIAGTYTSYKEGTGLFNKNTRSDFKQGNITNYSAADTLNMVSDSLKGSLLANQELRKEQKKSASRGGIGRSILGGGSF